MGGINSLPKGGIIAGLAWLSMLKFLLFRQQWGFHCKKMSSDLTSSVAILSHSCGFLTEDAIFCIQA